MVYPGSPYWRLDALILVVDSDQQHVLLGLPALIQEELRLLTQDGTDLMPSFSNIFNLDVDVDWGTARMKLTKQLNSMAVKLRMERIDLTAPEFDPYDSLKFSEFGPVCTDATVLRPALPIGAAVPTAASIADIDLGDEADCIEVQDSTDESEDDVEHNELGDESSGAQD